jgi:hypothetical protein
VRMQTFERFPSRSTAPEMLGGYIGDGIAITPDPDSRIRNQSVLRLHVRDDDGRRCFWMAARHRWAHFQKYEKINERMPMAFAFGVAIHHVHRSPSPGCASGGSHVIAGLRDVFEDTDDETTGRIRHQRSRRSATLPGKRLEILSTMPLPSGFPRSRTWQMLSTMRRTSRSLSPQELSTEGMIVAIVRTRWVSPSGTFARILEQTDTVERSARSSRTDPEDECAHPCE